jgi:hypothetical protein
VITFPELALAPVLLEAIVVAFGNPTVPVAIEGVPLKVSVMKGGTMPEFETVSVVVGSVIAVTELVTDASELELAARLGSVVVMEPSWPPGIADPTPELVNCEGTGKVAVSGASAGSFM